jgi:hypothetical protein
LMAIFWGLAGIDCWERRFVSNQCFRSFIDSDIPVNCDDGIFTKWLEAQRHCLMAMLIKTSKGVGLIGQTKW